ncbi:MAG: tRNA adenosine(34) deaminase TadA [Erysipelotrichaceae bacterium]|jgi:tRNA(adenine34) deaminase|uniref:tRNA-specific adenosine deaminase n=2 Tax=Copranaerobaculum intestinale TaxID=2692629 RepID=A0A6N8U2Z0_9FIRM|nr:tRNA adenosine(34) deaminase TadA [Copranaerobaculum intestinale]MBS6374250.1 tRNA adenosine(34) deaminase TadA [Erysipelotrichaceae bacterium]MXQ72636.1 nucleoside deaminase [Copranaerobaculum intestinale]
MTNDERFMKAALREAVKARDMNEVPIGCVIVHEGKIIAKAHNLREKKQLSTAHAEILAINKACKKIGSWRLEECTLYVTLEPCVMCSGAILLSRINRVVYGAKDPKGGCLDSCIQIYKVKGFNHYPIWNGGILKDSCSEIISSFFREKRRQNKVKSNF